MCVCRPHTFLLIGYADRIMFDVFIRGLKSIQDAMHKLFFLPPLWFLKEIIIRICLSSCRWLLALALNAVSFLS